jgi:hypothetical protein
MFQTLLTTGSEGTCTNTFGMHSDILDENFPQVIEFDAHIYIYHKRGKLNVS